MAASDNIIVGVFDDIPGVPENFRGCRIYYSKLHKKFAIVDKNTNETIQMFELPHYDKFMRAGVIIFQQRETQDFLDEEYEEWREENEAKLREEAKRARKENDRVIARNGIDERELMRLSNETADDDFDRAYGLIEDDDAPQIGHLLGFFLAVAGIAIAVILTRMVILPLVTNIQPLF